MKVNFIVVPERGLEPLIREEDDFESCTALTIKCEHPLVQTPIIAFLSDISSACITIVCYTLIHQKYKKGTPQYVKGVLLVRGQEYESIQD